MYAFGKMFSESMISIYNKVLNYFHLPVDNFFNFVVV